jgi:hypothetical protein
MFTGRQHRQSAAIDGVADERIHQETDSISVLLSRLFFAK